MVLRNSLHRSRWYLFQQRYFQLRRGCAMHLRIDALGGGIRTMEPSMLKLGFRSAGVALVLILLATAGARADSLAAVTSLAALSANDTIVSSPPATHPTTPTP